MRFVAVWWGLAACGDPVPLPPCQEATEPTADLVPTDVAWGEFTDGDDVLYGDPPQGGAPYAPFRMRVGGMTALDQGATATLVATDLADGTPLGEVEYNLRFTCANVGDSAGMWMAPDVHARFFGWALEDLAGRDAVIELDVVDLQGAAVQTSVVGRLAQMP